MATDLPLDIKALTWLTGKGTIDVEAATRILNEKPTPPEPIPPRATDGQERRQGDRRQKDRRQTP